MEAKQITAGAIKLEPGGVYVIEMDIILPASSLKAVKSSLAAFGAENGGMRFLLLDRGLRIARESVTPEMHIKHIDWQSKEAAAASVHRLLHSLRQSGPPQFAPAV